MHGQFSRLDLARSERDLAPAIRVEAGMFFLGAACHYLFISFAIFTAAACMKYPSDKRPGKIPEIQGHEVPDFQAANGNTAASNAKKNAKHQYSMNQLIHTN